MPASILVVDDDKNVRELVLDILADAGYEARGAAAVDAAERQLEEAPADLVLLDLELPGEHGSRLLPRLKAMPEAPAVVILTGDRRTESIVEMMRQGADDYLVKPVEEGGLLHRIGRVLEARALRGQVDRLKEPRAIDGPRHGIIGESPPLLAALHRVGLVAATDVTILIAGESGTGKELFARAIHAESGRAAGPFVVASCAAIPGTLLEDALFGHARGAFTGAIKDHRGVFEEARGGTLFLDEIGEVALEVQAKLLRAVENRAVRPIGSERDVATDVRLLTATHRDLRAEIAAGQFRADLYYRLSVFPVELPPLRDRRDDIPCLSRHFAERFSREIERPFSGFGDEAVQALLAGDWPGNIRQLENVVKQAVIVAAGAAIDVSHLPKEQAESARAGEPLPPFGEAKRRFERGYLERLLRASGGNVVRAATLSGIDRKEIYARVKKYGLSLADVRSEPPR